MEISTNTYRPLPEYLTIQKSDIEGLGVFATKFIPKGTDLGISHHIIKEELVRTPLGGFYNHSNTPTCISKVSCTEARLETLKDVLPGEEITASYALNPLCSPSYEKVNNETK